MVQQLKIAIQGGPASFHDVAARKSFAKKSLETLPCESFHSLCKALAAGETDFAVMAIENALAGGILSNYTLLLQNNFSIIGELWLPIDQNIMALPGQNLADIHTVLTHPVALLQCGTFLGKHPQMQPQENHDTAESARHIKENNLKGVAAIASEEAAKLYGMQILQAHIADRKDNYTRFLLLSRETAPSAIATKASIILGLSEKDESLEKLLLLLEAQEIAVTLTQPLPAISTPEKQYIALDLEGKDSEQVQKAIAKVKTLVKELKQLGTYKGVAHPRHNAQAAKTPLATVLHA
ncbi:prephenate dehydratase [Pontibacter harenae]|uniref:prephenate dehydratase n=1 Tax=Pontibacter harenae TaxID=2894083 RepID=UPI001E5D5A29|nr:prephenate dehydratase domain-containing protein [Pontibacter harenae]MCC9167142.1 prephenate dehydratase [Pontibacter harenae]